MVVDIGEVKTYIKPKADSTLRNMRKDDLIEYIRCLEHNYNVAVSFNENQARYIENLGVLESESLRPKGRWVVLDECANSGVYCSVCHKKVYKEEYANQKLKANYCPNCGAKMEG